MFPGCKTYRLYERGGAGICCDVDGVALGPMRLVERVDEGLRKRYRVCSAEVLAGALTMAYGRLPDEVMVYLAGGIRRVAESLGDGNVPLAMIKAVQLGFPEIEADNLARMAACDMAKFNPWHDLLGLFTDAAHAGANSVVGTANAGEAPKTPHQQTPKGPARLSHEGIKKLISENNKSKQSDELITAVVYKESRYSPAVEAGEKHKAVGLMQMRQIALNDLRDHNLGDYSLADMKDPVKNIQAGTAYLQLRIDPAHGNVTEALNGYGTGKGYADNILAAEKALKENKTEDPVHILKRTIGE